MVKTNFFSLEITGDWKFLKQPKNKDGVIIKEDIYINKKVRSKREHFEEVTQS